MRDNKLIQIDTIIQHFIRGNATPDEERILYNRIKESPEIRKDFSVEKIYGMLPKSVHPG